MRNTWSLLFFFFLFSYGTAPFKKKKKSYIKFFYFNIKHNQNKLEKKISNLNYFFFNFVNSKTKQKSAVLCCAGQN